MTFGKMLKHNEMEKRMQKNRSGLCLVAHSIVHFLLFASLRVFLSGGAASSGTGGGSGGVAVAVPVGSVALW